MGRILQPKGSHPMCPYGAHPTAQGVTSYGSPWGTSYSPRGHTLCVAMGHILQPNRSPGVASYSPRGHTLWVPMGHILQPNRSPWGTSYSLRGHILWVPMGHILQPKGSHPMGLYGSHPTAQ